MSGESEYYASATVTISIRVTSEGHWGKSATVEEVMRIGGRETVEAITHALAASGLKYEVVSKPTVGAVTWERKK